MNSFLVLAVVFFLMFCSSNVYANDKLRDPTRPLYYSAAAEQEQALQLQALLNKRDGVTAVINGKTVKQGDSIGGWQVIDLTRSQAVVSDGQTRRVLVLRTSVSKKVQR